MLAGTTAATATPKQSKAPTKATGVKSAEPPSSGMLHARTRR